MSTTGQTRDQAILVIVVILALLFGATWRAHAAEGQNLNVTAPTLGGTQVWQDSYFHGGWRIQRNVVTGHHRLLDPKDWRHAWGSYESCQDAFQTMRQNQNIVPRSRHLVVLVHGIARSVGTFDGMAEALNTAGYEAITISYPSTRDTIESHAESLAKLLNKVEGAERVSFVTHSMGGLVVRHLLDREDTWQQRIKIDRIVMIAPPNQGSQVASWLKDFGPYQWLYGKAGQQLPTEESKHIPALDHPFAVIAGGRTNEQGFNPLLTGDNDGTVRVEETKLDGMSDFIVVNDIHAGISNHPESIANTLQYLKTGAFHTPKSRLKES